MIHCDLWGPYKTKKNSGAHYFLTVADDYCKDVWVYLLQDKSQVEKTILDFFALVQRQFNKRVKIVRSDNGTEFMRMKEYFRSTCKIPPNFVCRHSPTECERGKEA